MMELKSFRTDDYIDDILNRYGDMVYKIAYSQMKNKADAEDVFQEVFVRFIRYNPNFENDQHIKAWLIRVTLNCSKNIFKSAWFRRTTTLDDDIAISMPETSSVYETVLTLPAKYRMVIHLHYYEDMSIADISNATGKNLNTIKSHLKRGRELLKQKLKGDFDDV